MTADVQKAVQIARDVMDTLRRFRMAQTTERELQNAIETVLQQEGFDFEREAELGPQDRPDFLLADGVALEVKVLGTPSSVERQLRRYAEHASVHAVLLVTTRYNHRPPAELEGKPVLTLCVGGGAFL